MIVCLQANQVRYYLEKLCLIQKDAQGKIQLEALLVLTVLVAHGCQKSSLFIFCLKYCETTKISPWPNLMGTLKVYNGVLIIHFYVYLYLHNSVNGLAQKLHPHGTTGLSLCGLPTPYHHGDTSTLGRAAPPPPTAQPLYALVHCPYSYFKHLPMLYILEHV